MAAKWRECVLYFWGGCCLFILKKQEPVVLSVVVGDNARPPCKAWKWEEKEEGSVGRPCLTSCGIQGTRRRGGVGYGGVSREEKGGRYCKEKGLDRRLKKGGC